MAPELQWFREARYGLFIHFGLYSMLGRGEWVLNKERIPKDEYMRLAAEFRPDKLDFDALIGRARERWGMRYANLTTKHHEGFCLYDSQLTDFTAPKSACGRDLVAEFVEACRKHDMRISLYHSLNDWTTSPNAVDALERPDECHDAFIAYVHGQIREILSNYGRIDVMWYDGWWPFRAEGWKAHELDAMVRELQPHILVNGRSGLPGDFGTPEGHISADPEGHPWEACMTLNDNWGYHQGDTAWKSAKTVAEMLRQCAAGQGNLLLNVGPRGDGSVPEESVRILDETGDWLRANEEAIRGTIPFVGGMYERQPHERADWTHSGRFSARDDAFYWHILHWPGAPLRLAGLECTVTEVTELANGTVYPFRQDGDRLFVDGVPESCDPSMPVVFRFRTKETPSMYRCGGWRTPEAPHPRYDPLPSDIQSGA